MYSNDIRTGPYHPFGDRYATFLGSDHFLGREPIFDSWIAPKTNVKKEDRCYKVELALPGFTREDIKTSVEGRKLIVEARKENIPVMYLRKEFETNMLKRSFQLPKGIDEERVEAVMNHGLLTITLHYQKEPEPGKAVEVV